MEYKDQPSSSLYYNALSEIIELCEEKKVIDQKHEEIKCRKEEFSETLSEIVAKINSFYDDNNKPGLLDALIEANQLNSNDIEHYYKDKTLISNIIKSKVLNKIMEIIFDNECEDTSQQYVYDLDDDLLEEDSIDKEEMTKINHLLTYNGLVFLMMMTAFSSEISTLVASMNFFEHLFMAIDWYDSSCIKIGLSIGLNILIDSTPAMIKDFNIKSGVTQRLVDIAAKDTFPEPVAEKITDEAVAIACQSLYIFTLRGRNFGKEYTIGYLDSISRLAARVSDLAKVGLLASMSSLISRKEIDPQFLFDENETEEPLIDNLLLSVTCDFVPLRSQAIRLLRYGITSDFIGAETKGVMIEKIDFGEINSIIETVPDDLNEILSLIYDFTENGEEFASHLLESSTYETIIRNFESFKYSGRSLSLKIFLLITSNSSSEFEEKMFEIGVLNIMFSMLGDSESTDMDIIHALSIFLFKIKDKYISAAIEVAQGESVDEPLLAMKPTIELESVLHLLEITNDDDDDDGD